MIDLAKRFFSGASQDASSNHEEDRTHDIHIATCAILLEMANIDGEFSDSERENIISALKKEHHLSDEDISGIIKASEEELEGSVDLWRFTNLINQNYSPEEKIKIIETVWMVAYADGQLDKHEDYLMHKLANLLRLSHKQLIDAKLKVLHGNNK
ncbi:TerB family tellurite resistance protein [Thermodesulfobacteriota bacterium]